MGPKTKDITGQKYNLLTAIKWIRTDTRRHAIWLFQCECGNTIETIGSRVIFGETKTCGCSRFLDLTGQRFGKLVAIKRIIEKEEKPNSVQWECLCDCGNITYVRTTNLRFKGGTRSCGCSIIKEGKTKDKDYAYKYKLKKNYNLTIEDYNNLLEQQNHRCAICFNLINHPKDKRRLSVDHDHKTGKVRGLLCSNCNSGIGHLQDNPDILLNALRYLCDNKEGVKIALTLYENEVA